MVPVLHDSRIASWPHRGSALVVERFSTVDRNYEKFLDDLPEDLQRQMKWCIHGEALKNSTFFYGAAVEFLQSGRCFLPSHEPSRRMPTANSDSPAPI